MALVEGTNEAGIESVEFAHLGDSVGDHSRLRSGDSCQHLLST
jgi:hypothetical protein